MVLIWRHPLGASFLSPVFSIIYIDNKEKDYHSKCYNVIHYSNLLTPLRMKENFFIQNHSFLPEILGKMERRTLLVLPRNSPIFILNSQYNMSIYLYFLYTYKRILFAVTYHFLFKQKYF